jgi:chemotaxis protein CheD
MTSALAKKVKPVHTIKNQANRILPGFENINRFWCRQENIEMVKILPGEFYVTTSNEIIATVLGSCISVCIRDCKLGIGGMNHFMLPENNKQGDDSWEYNKVDKAARYGSDAMEHLVNELLKNGGSKKRFEVKITGGGRIMAKMNDIGRKNIFFIKDYLQTEGYEIASEDVGEVYPRKVRYFPKTGKLHVKKLRSMHNDTVISREKDYKKHIEEDKIEGEVELF